MRTALIVAALTALTACSGSAAPSPEESLQEEAHVAVIGLLKDPESARFQDTVGEIYANEGAVCGQVNSRDGYGGYNGFEPYTYVRGKGAAFEGDDFIAGLEACTQASRARQKEAEAKTRDIVASMDPATRKELEKEQQSEH